MNVSIGHKIRKRSWIGGRALFCFFFLMNDSDNRSHDMQTERKTDGYKVSRVIRKKRNRSR